MHMQTGRTLRLYSVPPLQADIGPFQHNQSEGGVSGAQEGSRRPAGPGRPVETGHGSVADRPWRLEDLEGELEKKVELLEKERNALRLETVKHRQEIDLDINKLHHRLSGLEEGDVFKEKHTNYI